MQLHSGRVESVRASVVISSELLVDEERVALTAASASLCPTCLLVCARSCMVEESGTLESQLEATKVRISYTGSHSCTLHSPQGLGFSVRSQRSRLDLSEGNKEES